MVIVNIIERDPFSPAANPERNIHAGTPTAAASLQPARAERAARKHIRHQNGPWLGDRLECEGGFRCRPLPRLSRRGGRHFAVNGCRRKPRDCEALSLEARSDIGGAASSAPFVSLVARQRLDSGVSLSLRNWTEPKRSGESVAGRQTDGRCRDCLQREARE
ncbi:hypothetical protein LZ31DRAFT_383283 [Colletotrichum somersetense]|nr:hypothetical protein LZ31DRAFT_383283 [Colletotrichum somersetense]